MASLFRPILLSVFTVSISVATTIFANASVPQGKGTKTATIQIMTCQQLQDINKDSSANYVLAGDINCTDTLNWNNGAGFMPINNFSGTFDGQMHHVLNLMINRPDNSMVGVFASSTGTIQKVSFDNESIHGLATRAPVRPAKSYMGGIVALNEGLLTQSSAQGNYYSNAIWSGVAVGENMGKVYTDRGYGQIQGNSNIGGLIGYQYKTGDTVNCYSDATVKGIPLSGASIDSIDAGGIAATNNGRLVASYATGDIQDYGIGTGGLVGWNQGNANLSDSYATGSVTGLTAGGVVGYNTGRIVHVYAIGAVNGSQNHGGIIGTLARGTVQENYYNKDTTGQADTNQGGIPATTQQMFSKTTYSNWDFTGAWVINEGKDYPYLDWEDGDGYADLVSLNTSLRGYDKASPYFSKYGYFDGNTYALSTGNNVRVLQTPNIWGEDLTKVHFFGWDGKNVDFGGLPDCTSSASVCTPTNTPCTHLNAFNNGITGQDTKRCLGPADSMVDNIYNAMIQAHTSIDMTTLEAFPDGRFLAAMRNAITWLAVNDRKVTIRILGGVALPYSSDDHLTSAQLQAKYVKGDQDFLKALTRDIPASKVNNITLYVGSMRSCAGAPTSQCVSNESTGDLLNPYRSSWNHSKIIDVDGVVSIVGGQNWWTTDYLTNDPISDLNLEVQGPASMQAEPFIDSLWNFICRGGNSSIKSVATSTSWINGQYGNACLNTLNLPHSAKTFGTTSVMGIGRLGLGMFKGSIPFDGDEPANQSEVAQNTMLSQAQSVIRIAQQNLQYAPVLGLFRADYARSNAAGNIYDILASFLLKQGNLYIVNTSDGAKSAGSVPYSTGSKLGNLADTLKDRVKKLAPSMSDQDINSLLCQSLHLTGIRHSADVQWPDGKKFANHSKAWIVDDQDYYVGSHNIYPANLQEYGYIVGGKIATDDFIAQYWNPLWKYSSAAAITGSEVPTAQCYFDVKHLNNLKCKGRTVISSDKVQYTGCTDSNDDTPITFVTSVSTPIDPSETECSAYQSGANQDNWTGCGQAELGSQDYTITW